jgi:hypothetical protein
VFGVAKGLVHEVTDQPTEKTKRTGTCVRRCQTPWAHSMKNGTRLIAANTAQFQSV